MTHSRSFDLDFLLAIVKTLTLNNVTNVVKSSHFN